MTDSLKHMLYVLSSLWGIFVIEAKPLLCPNYRRRLEVSDLRDEVSWLRADVRELRGFCACDPLALSIRRDLEGFCAWVCAGCGKVERITA